MTVGRHVEHAGQRLTSASRHTLFRNPQRLIDQGVQQFDETVRRLHGAMPRRLAVDAARVDALTRQLDAVSPASVLERGYTYTLGADGKVLRRAQDASAGDPITTVLADGRVHSVVEPGPSAPTTPAKTRRRKKNLPDTDPGLFHTDNPD